MAEDNYKWFSDRIRDKRLSQRALATKLEMDPSSLSLLLHGKRRMRVEQASDIAKALDLPINEVMRKGGAENVPVATGGPGGHASLPLIGWIDGEGRAHLSHSGQTIELAGTYPLNSQCIQWRSAQTKAEIFDGWIAVTRPRVEPNDEAMIDRFCLVGIKGEPEGEGLVRKVRRGYVPGKYTLISHFGDMTHDVELAWYSPIIAMSPI